MPRARERRHQADASFAMVGSGALAVAVKGGTVQITGPSSFVLSLSPESARLLAEQLVDAAETALQLRYG